MLDVQRLIEKCQLALKETDPKTPSAKLLNEQYLCRLKFYLV